MQFWEKAMRKASIYFIMKKVKASKTTDDLRHQNLNKTKRTVNIVAAVTANIKEDHRLTSKELASSYGVSYRTVNNILHDNLGLVKKSECRLLPLRIRQGESANLQGIHRLRQPPLHGHIGQHCDDG
jgi:hypothetical protein